MCQPSKGDWNTTFKRMDETSAVSTSSRNLGDINRTRLSASIASILRGVFNLPSLETAALGEPGAERAAALAAADAPPAVAPATPRLRVLNVGVKAREHGVMRDHRHGLSGRRHRREDERR